ncbi:hypothetical protein KIN20_016189 [Parelaphostrongylus tenuis]|uniref:Uncharacterized protein n=1 Tax=Parelaphostrongylus tenuis TaxID=148309 RepID=A0AAD5MG30_PARTN|nr:hypothetical protein KIN20_016189 [Parelaphostrongylus tenuis]
MDTNRTLLEDVIADEFPSPSTSTFAADEAVLTHDRLITEETDVNNGTRIAVNPIVTPNYRILERFITTMSSLLSENAWILYTLSGMITVTVIVIVCLIVLWIVKNKKRVIHQDDGHILTDSYDGFSLRRCFSCCIPRLEKDSKLRARQNSASNLDPYRRPPLPSINRKTSAYDPYINVFNRTDALDGLKKLEPVDERTLAINIRSIRGVPHVHLQPEEYRIYRL